MVDEHNDTSPEHCQVATMKLQEPSSAELEFQVESVGAAAVDQQELIIQRADELCLSEIEIENLLKARGSLRVVLGNDSQRTALFSGGVNLKQIFVARQAGQLVGYLLVQLGDSSPFQANWRDFRRIHGRSASWRYLAYRFLEWRGARYPAYIYSLKVDLFSRGKGIAAHLLRKIEDFLLAEDVSSITLEVRADNRAALRLYLRCGYEIIGFHSSNGMAALIGFGNVVRMQKILIHEA